MSSIDWVKPILIREYQHRSTQVNKNQHESTPVQNRSRSDSSQIYDQINHETLLLYKDIYFLLIIYFIYFQEKPNVTSIRKTQGPLAPGKKTRNDLNFKKNSKTWNTPKLFWGQKPSRPESFTNSKIRKILAFHEHKLSWIGRKKIFREH